MNIENGVIVFDNLYRRPTDSLGDYTNVRAKTPDAPEPFANSNAPGLPPQIDSIEEIGGIGFESGARLKRVFGG